MKSAIMFFLTGIFLLGSCTMHDVNNGLQEEYYPNGGLKSQIMLKNGLKNGTAKYYNEQGKLISEAEYADDMKNGPLVNYSSETGKPILEAYFINDMQNGKVVQYYREGMLFRESNYVNDRVDGIVKTYWPDGKTKAENLFRMGKPGIGLVEYDKNGNLIKQPTIKTKRLNNMAVELSISGEFQSGEFFLSDLEDGKFFNSSGKRRLRSQDGVAYYNFSMNNNSGKVSIVAKVKTTFGNTLILVQEI